MVGTLGNQRTRRENHAVIQILDAELEVQAVIDAGRQLINALLVDAIDRIERQIITNMLQLIGRLDLFLALKNAHILAVYRTPMTF